MFRWGKEKRLKRDLERQNRPRFADTSFDGYFTMQCLGEMAELKKVYQIVIILSCIISVMTVWMLMSNGVNIISTLILMPFLIML